MGEIRTCVAKKCTRCGAPVLALVETENPVCAECVNEIDEEA